MTTPNKAPADIAAIIAEAERLDNVIASHLPGSNGKANAEAELDAFARRVYRALLSAASASLPPADGEVAEMVELLERIPLVDPHDDARKINHARSLLLRQSAALKEAEARARRWQDKALDCEKHPAVVALLAEKSAAESRVRALEERARLVIAGFDRYGWDLSKRRLQVLVDDLARAVLFSASSAPAKPEMPECVRKLIEVCQFETRWEEGMMGWISAVESYYAPASAAGKEK